MLNIFISCIVCLTLNSLVNGMPGGYRKGFGDDSIEEYGNTNSGGFKSAFTDGNAGDGHGFGSQRNAGFAASEHGSQRRTNSGVIHFKSDLGHAIGSGDREIVGHIVDAERDTVFGPNQNGIKKTYQPGGYNEGISQNGIFEFGSSGKKVDSSGTHSRNFGSGSAWDGEHLNGHGHELSNFGRPKSDLLLNGNGADRHESFGSNGAGRYQDTSLNRGSEHHFDGAEQSNHFGGHDHSSEHCGHGHFDGHSHGGPGHRHGAGYGGISNGIGGHGHGAHIGHGGHY